MRSVTSNKSVLLAAAVLLCLLLASCGGGGGLTEDIPLNLPGDNSGSGGGNGLGLGGDVVIPPSESYVDHSTSSDSVAVKWVKNNYNTVPPITSSSRVYQNSSLLSWAEQIYALINAERQANGLAPFVREPHLEALAQSHARDMGLRNFFAHDNLDGMSPWDRLRAIDPPLWEYAGENAAKGQESPQEVVNQWMNSPKHRANILNPTYTHLGVGVYIDAADKATPTNFIQFFASFRDDPAQHDWLSPGDSI